MSGFTRFIALISAFFTMIFSPSTTFEKKVNIKVMTYNIYYSDLSETRLDAITQQVKAVLPDSFGTQEVKNISKDYLDKNLPEYESYAVSDQDGDDISYNVLYWLKSKYTKVDEGYIFLSKTPDTPSKGWDARHPRMLQWVVLENKETGFRYVHANTHLDHVGTQARMESVKLINEYISSFEYPTIVSGDFNCRYTGNEIKTFKSLGWQNTMNMSGIERSTDTFHDYNGSDANHSPIDHIFVKGVNAAKNWTIHREMYNGIYPSDHFALSVELELSYTITAKQNYNFIKENK